jgi:hypothetical protein
MLAKVKRRAKPQKRRRIQVGLIVSAEIKQRLVQAASQTGLTQSQIAERLIERAFHDDVMFAAMSTTVEQVKENWIGQQLRAKGLTKTYTGPGGSEEWVHSTRLARRSGFGAKEDDHGQD